jgi:hypothetical protein
MQNAFFSINNLKNGLKYKPKNIYNESGFRKQQFAGFRDNDLIGQSHEI